MHAQLHEGMAKYKKLVETQELLALG